LRFAIRQSDIENVIHFIGLLLQLKQFYTKTGTYVHEKKALIFVSALISRFYSMPLGFFFWKL